MSFDHKTFLNNLTRLPGVYRMIAADNEVLYIGKAKNLKRRVSSYFTRSLNRRIQIMVNQIHCIEITTTQTEAEALILENNLIKKLRPRFNILLRDDKSYPYIYLSADEFPRLAFHRGARNKKGRYFGPYASAGAVRETLHLLQKVFPIRQCEDSFYRNRSRACLQYQIERCSAPCVGLVTKKDYQSDLNNTCGFLLGKASAVLNDLTKRMEKAAAKLAYEEAARLRDQLISLRKIQEKQYISGEKGDLDIIAIATSAGASCIQKFSVRGGHNLGNRSWFPSMGEKGGPHKLMSAFLAQHYLERQAPAEILVSHLPEDQNLLEHVFTEQAGRKVRIKTNVRGERLRRLQMAISNAESALQARLAGETKTLERFQQLQDALHLDQLERMECYDISHTQGEKTTASCVVFNTQGPVNAEYRRFNIRSTNTGDDYAAIKEVILRRFKRLLEEQLPLPDLVIIDGGKGQLAQGETVLKELALEQVQLLGIAKGIERKAGLEQLFLSSKGQPVRLSPDSQALHLLQHIRNEAHRFAITGHRKQRRKARKDSILEEIEGIGSKRRRDLVKYFGGLSGLRSAGIEDIALVRGISRKMAKKIYQHLHG